VSVTLFMRRTLKCFQFPADVSGNRLHRQAAMPIAAISPVSALGDRTAAPAPRQPAPPPVLPDAPKPVTPANAAVHIMKVPTSRLVEAFASLQRARGQQSGGEDADAPHDDKPQGDVLRPVQPRPAEAPRTAAMPLLDLAPAPPPQLDVQA
jgi:hypothetical protein